MRSVFLSVDSIFLERVSQEVHALSSHSYDLWVTGVVGNDQGESFVVVL